ncbi:MULTISPECIES: hypothetical protein [Carboxydocella]|uniref:Cytochrome b subunit of formate dehydrogenase n=2 Tax=Carboxydocella TaxID=178898 RepID=A0A1T4PG32_9FIRM|nr:MULTISPECIES: hypothetical protein [Carboxydocella]AVX21450.1 Cytochrome b subunit of formate dehydrogenase [Carboxydocella thermautotrophica]AVX31938.1 Cytochrome b subunit of formate dehydrogenase [Carboxydocella thermautotrophica]SJZ90439.1 Cytochrome b subunit of formate dehydrogenase [Carboxydocella sporoproducens DSM 16521]
MKEIKLDFLLHWLYAVVFGLLLISGLVLMGAKTGWLMDYQLAWADYLHRTLAAVFILLTLVAVFIEVTKLSGHYQGSTAWLVVKKSGMGIFVLVSTLLFAFSGILIWVCEGFSHVTLAFAVVIHDLLTLISVPVIIWHIYDKAHGLPLELGEG